MLQSTSESRLRGIQYNQNATEYGALSVISKATKKTKGTVKGLLIQQLLLCKLSSFLHSTAVVLYMQDADLCRLHIIERLSVKALITIQGRLNQL